MAYSKVIYGGNTIIDLTADTVSAEKLLLGYTAHGADGEALSGTCTFDADTSDANAADGDILAGKTAYKGGERLTGTMQNRAAVSGTISAKAGRYTIPEGYHNGNGSVGISLTEQEKIIAGNIKSGVTILGVTGNYSGAGVSVQEKTVTPGTSAVAVLPDAGYFLSKVTVNAIPYAETPNASGGTTVTIG